MNTQRHRCRLLTSPLVAVILFGCYGSAFAQWGHLKGQIVFQGAIPQQEVLIQQGAAAKNPNVCAANAAILSEELVIDPNTKGIANCVIYLSRKPAKIHPALLKLKNKPVDFEIDKCIFKPHVLVVHKDQQVNVNNNDACSHNLKPNMIRNKVVNAVIQPRQRGVRFGFRAAEFLPMKVQNSIHPWMSAYWYVVDHPYAVVTDKEGKFEIKNLPVGEHSFKIWHEKAGYLTRSMKVVIIDDETLESNITAYPEHFEPKDKK